MNLNNKKYHKKQLDLAKSEVDVFMNNQNYEQNKLEQTRTKIRINGIGSSNNYIII